MNSLRKMYSPSGHPRCRWVCFFIGTDLEKFNITSLVHQWIHCSEWVPSDWQFKQLIKTWLHHSDIFNFKPFLQAKIFIILLYNIIIIIFIISSESGEKYAQIKNSPKLFKQICTVDFDVKGQQGMDFFIGESVIMDYRLVFWIKV